VGGAHGDYENACQRTAEVTRRASADDVSDHLELAARLLLR
jgi:hypothetical protein